MRLTCPNCQTQYNVSAGAIPVAGRTVKCGNCGESWFQPPISAEPESAVVDASVDVAPEVRPDAVPDPAPEPTPETAQVSDVSESVSPIVSEAAETTLAETMPADAGLTDTAHAVTEPADTGPAEDVVDRLSELTAREVSPPATEIVPEATPEPSSPLSSDVEPQVVADTTADLSGLPDEDLGQALSDATAEVEPIADTVTEPVSEPASGVSDAFASSQSTGFTHDIDAELDDSGPQFSAEAFSEDDFSETIISSTPFIRSSATQAADEDHAADMVPDTAPVEDDNPDFEWKTTTDLATPGEPTSEPEADATPDEAPAYHAVDRRAVPEADDAANDELEVSDEALDDAFEELSEEEIVQRLRETMDEDATNPIDPIDAVAAAIPTPERPSKTVDATSLQASLRNEPSAAPPVGAPPPRESDEIDLVPPKTRNQFGSGLSLAICVALILVAAYGLRAPISEAVPQAAPALERYAAFVDRTRLGVQSVWSDIQS